MLITGLVSDNGQPLSKINDIILMTLFVLKAEIASGERMMQFWTIFYNFLVLASYLTVLGHMSLHHWDNLSLHPHNHHHHYMTSW